MIDPANAHWRNSARHPRLFMMDAYAAFPFLLFLLHIRWWTFGLAILTAIFFAGLERFGFTIPVFLRWFRVFLAGYKRPARPWQ